MQLKDLTDAERARLIICTLIVIAQDASQIEAKDFNPTYMKKLKKDIERILDLIEESDRGIVQ